MMEKIIVMCRPINHILHELQEVATKAEQDEILAPLEEKTRKEISKIFKKQGQLFIERLKNKRTQFAEAITPDDAENDFNNIFGMTESEFKTALNEALRRAMEAGAGSTMQEIGVSISFDIENPRARQWIQDRAARMVTNINETTRSQIKTIIEKSFSEKWTYRETEKAISERFKEFAEPKPQKHIRSRAELVAVTENAEAFGEGNFEAAEQVKEAGIDMEKYWSNTGDARVSDRCRSNTAAGWIELGEPFPSGDMREPRFPGCRCKVLYRRKKQAA